jgi:hypothetical protein
MLLLLFEPACYFPSALYSCRLAGIIAACSDA